MQFLRGTGLAKLGFEAKQSQAMRHISDFFTSTKTRGTTRRFAMLSFSVLLLLQLGCRHAARPITNDAIGLQTDSMFEKLIGIRRDIHAHPELAGHEARTSATIAAHLRRLGLEVRTGHYGHSVVGIVRGAHPGKTIAWRAELDALPGEFTDPALFKSQTPGVHHACGHDIHIAIALGIAEVMAQHRQALHGTVMFVFQPEEETFKGAKALVERGVFAAVKPDEIYGLRVTVMPVGQIVVRANELFAYQRGVSIRLKNTLSTAQIAQLTTAIQSALARTRVGANPAKPWEIQNTVDPNIGLTNNNSDFQDYLIMDPSFSTRTENGELVLTTTLYETNAGNLTGILTRIEQVIAASGHTSQLLAVSYVQENPTVLNDPILTAHAVDALNAAGADVRLAYGQVPFFNDDFAYFQQTIPGVYFFLGGSNAAKGLIAMNHAPDFQVDEESIRVGVRSFSSLISARLGGR
jgi:metal-dependent amidase/aminoacylase/carboxypeptidase family protein